MTEREYVLGTHDDEIERLGLQHRVWRPDVLDAWRRAGLARGQTVLDVGCGPGHATLDLAEIVGATGRVVAVDQSRRFLDHLAAETAARGWTHVDLHERNLSETGWPEVAADMVWCRWIFAFVRDPRALLTRVAGAVKPGGTLVIHEYFDYRTWRLMPRVPEVETFVAQVMESWRAEGGEPDIGTELPGWLESLGLEIVDLRPLLRVASHGEGMWEWPAAFLRVGSRRLASLGYLSAEETTRTVDVFSSAEVRPGTKMVTPAVLSVTARRPISAS